MSPLGPSAVILTGPTIGITRPPPYLVRPPDPGFSWHYTTPIGARREDLWHTHLLTDARWDGVQHVEGTKRLVWIDLLHSG